MRECVAQNHWHTEGYRKLCTSDQLAPDGVILTKILKVLHVAFIPPLATKGKLSLQKKIFPPIKAILPPSKYLNDP
jgi:hypothetical protein